MNKRGEVTYKDQFSPWLEGYLVTIKPYKMIVINIDLRQAKYTANNAILKMMKG